jgi:hypothetical protein
VNEAAKFSALTGGTTVNTINGRVMVKGTSTPHSAAGRRAWQCSQVRSVEPPFTLIAAIRGLSSSLAFLLIGRQMSGILGLVGGL